MYERIRHLREDKDLNQTVVANYLNVHQVTYSGYETGVITIPVEMVSKLADFHEVSTDYLLNRTDEMKPYPRKR